MYIPWFFFAIFILIVFIFSMMLVKYYVDPAESYWLSTLTISLSLTTSLLCVLVIPIDIFVVSNPNLNTLGMMIDANSIKLLILYLYCTSLAISFIVIPFTYFYGEERQDFLDIDYEIDKNCTKLWNASKYTFFFVLFTFVLIVVGLIFRPGYSNGMEKGKEIEWVRKLFDVDHVGESAIFFSIAVLTCLGIAVWVIYGGYGLGSLPMFLVKGTKSLQETKNELSNDLSKIREKYRAIQEKYARSHTKISKIDQRVLNNLKKQEKLISTKNEKIDLIENKFGSLQKIFVILKPFRVIIGFFCVFLSGIIFLSLTITTIDKIYNSKCGWSCGFIIEKNNYLNPVDSLLVSASRYFPFDYFFFFVIIFYIFITALYGLIKLGIKILCFTIYEIKKESTMPQALLILAFMMNLIILALSNQTTNLTPQYSMFGSQKFEYFGNSELCSLNEISAESKTNCHLSNVSSILSKISISIPFFGMIFFFGNIAFLLLSLFSFLGSLSKTHKHEIEEEEIDLEDESRRLVNYS